jgi:hypothetical protein
MRAHRLCRTSLNFKRLIPAAERGQVMLIVMFVMLVILVGGMAAVALTSSELTASGGFRTRSVGDQCAAQALYQLRSATTDVGNLPGYTSGIGYGTVPISSANVPYFIGHYNTSLNTSGQPNTTQPTWRAISSQYIDLRSQLQGKNATNVIGTGSGLTQQVFAGTAVCGGVGSGYGAREMEVITTFTTLGNSVIVQ